MTRKEVEALLPSMPPQMAAMVRAVLIRPQTAVQLAELYCLSYRTQLSKARARYGIPVYGSPTENKPYFTYRLILEDNDPPINAVNPDTSCRFCGETGPSVCMSCREEVR